MRILANTLFSGAIGCALLMQAFHVPQQLALFAFFCVALSAILANMMWIRSVGLIGIGGLSLVYQEIGGSNLSGTVLVAVTSALLTTAVILLVLADISSPRKESMFMKFLNRNKSSKGQDHLTILLASAHPEPSLIAYLAGREGVNLREAFTTRGVLEALPGTSLVVLDDVVVSPDTPHEVLVRTLETSGMPVTSPENFRAEPEEWLGRARLTSARQINYLPPRQVNLVNWSGGVGKTTLAMAIAKRFVERTGLPAAILELSMGGSALHARISEDLPEFFAIATAKAEPATWQGVSLYPMDGRTIDVLWSEDPEGVRRVLKEIRRKHTLFVVDCFPGHSLFPELSEASMGMVNLVVTSPRDDAVYQARRLMKEISQPAHLILNMANHLADRAESGVSVRLPYRESWAQSVDARLADPLLELVYPGWNRRKS